MGETIDMTPTWVQIAPTIALILTDGTHKGREEIKPELWRMADLADERNAMARQLVEVSELLSEIAALERDSNDEFGDVILDGTTDIFARVQTMAAKLKG